MTTHSCDKHVERPRSQKPGAARPCLLTGPKYQLLAQMATQSTYTWPLIPASGQAGKHDSV